MMSFEPTYEIKQGPPPRDFEEYATEVLQKFRLLLDTEPREGDVQDFLERNPCLVPCSPGHGPRHEVLLARPRLSGYDGREPDFMWIGGNSLVWYPVMVEIERPGKALFKKAGDRAPRAEFTQAKHQLAQWRLWWDHPANRAKFLADFGVSDSFVRGRKTELHTILVYGRRAEFEGSRELTGERAAIAHDEHEQLMSFDRLAPDRVLHCAITVTMGRGGRYIAKRLQPTFTLGPWNAEGLLVIDGLEDVIRGTSGISEERKAFLVSRLDYWKRWAEAPNKGVIHSGDFE